MAYCHCSPPVAPGGRRAQSFIIVPDFPVTFQPELSHTDFPWLWDERRESRIGLLPRNGDVSRIQWFETPPRRTTFAKLLLC